METLLIITGAILILSGFIGAFLPVIPGPSLSYVGLLFLQLTSDRPFDTSFLILWGLIVIIIWIIDSLIPIAGAKKYGGSFYGIAGCIIGLAAGFIFFPPLGIIIGPVAGAFFGELASGSSSEKAFRAAIGSVLGYFVGVLIKVGASSLMGYYFFINL